MQRSPAPPRVADSGADRLPHGDVPADAGEVHGADHLALLEPDHLDRDRHLVDVRHRRAAVESLTASGARERRETSVDGLPTLAATAANADESHAPIVGRITREGEG